MKALMLGLLAESSIHPGSGQSGGVVDLPVAREAATDYPVLPGSSLKGALLDRAREAWGQDDPKTKRLFGEHDNAGALLISDARLLLLPVRSLTGQYRWATCPHLLERYKRDRSRAGKPTTDGAGTVQKGQALTAAEGTLFLEERQFTVNGTVPAATSEAVAALVKPEEARARVADQLTVLNDADFAWFARYGLSINARNVLNPETKASENLWYEETLPPDTLMYALIAERSPGALDDFASLFGARPYLQAGGNATVGQGWFAVEVI